MTKRLYHYTTASGVFGILASKSFWISKSSFMNDPGELLYAWNMYIHEIEKGGDKIRPIFGPMVQWIQGVLEVQDFFILSLTKERDSLSLWQRYSKGSGYILEIDLENLTKEINIGDYKNNFNGFFEVYYDNDFQNKVVHVNIQNYITAQSNNRNFPLNSESTSDITFRILSSIFAFKHGSYKDESEVRGVFWIPNLKSLVVKESWLSIVNFRQQSDKIIPYIEIKFSSFNWLKSITLGPLNKDSVRKEGLQLYLLSKDINIPIFESDVPYRE
jgi:hypothetical protein